MLRDQRDRGQSSQVSGSRRANFNGRRSCESTQGSRKCQSGPNLGCGDKTERRNPVLDALDWLGYKERSMKDPTAKDARGDCIA